MSEQYYKSAVHRIAILNATQVNKSITFLLSKGIELITKHRCLIHDNLHDIQK